MAEGDARVRDPKAGVSDLPVRLVSGIVLAGVSGAALWLGGWYWIGLVVLFALIVILEWNAIVRRFGVSAFAEILWLFFGAAYVSAAGLAMVQVRLSYSALEVFLVFLTPVVAVDVGAYFVGRAVGGPKIAPKISPSKTWAGLIGGAIAASIVAVGNQLGGIGPAVSADLNATVLLLAVLAGTLIAVIAQAGDFFESWMKRRAKVKDSSNFIPGHGGFFDRLDGFLAVFFVLFVVAVAPGLLS